MDGIEAQRGDARVDKHGSELLPVRQGDILGQRDGGRPTLEALGVVERHLLSCALKPRLVLKVFARLPVRLGRVSAGEVYPGGLSFGPGGSDEVEKRVGGQAEEEGEQGSGTGFGAGGRGWADSVDLGCDRWVRQEYRLLLLSSHLEDE